MKIKKLVLMTMIILGITGCGNSAEKNNDFWAATINVLEDKLENNSYDEGNWQIGVQDKSQIEDKEHRSLTIREIFEEKNVTKTTMFSLQNQNDTKTISYIYKKSETDNNNRYDQTVTIESTDESYHEYKIIYSYEEYQNENYHDGKEANGKFKIGNDNKITYDNVPLLKEALNAYLTLINDFQQEFNLNYDEYDFVNLPELAKNLDVPDLDNIDEETSTTTDYYSEAYINARGFSLITFLKLNKDFSSAEFGIYNVEKKEYESNATVTFEKRGIADCYNIIQKNDPDVNYAVYFSGDTAYVYLQSLTDQEIIDDVQNQGTNATDILKTTNKSYSDY
ncbi:hypothetical protein [Thomasclavelia saccharogumia]|uniref:hypothetical protein n=1 Tax=Thomasclavelia saccharogumia TaxID=341225 RepID=UPI00047979E7|nr:hypothetical protein [Thomasclavelia saccharogumia]